MLFPEKSPLLREAVIIVRSVAATPAAWNGFASEPRSNEVSAALAVLIYAFGGSENVLRMFPELGVIEPPDPRVWEPNDRMQVCIESLHFNGEQARQLLIALDR